MGASLWNIRPWEAALPLAAIGLYVGFLALTTERARSNRAKLREQRRRQRQAERRLVRRTRAW